MFIALPVFRREQAMDQQVQPMMMSWPMALLDGSKSSASPNPAHLLYSGQCRRYRGQVGKGKVKTVQGMVGEVPSVWW